MDYDRTSSRVILFGGADGALSFGDTWAWDGKAWVQIAEFGPPARFAASMVATADGIILFGGVSAPNGAQPANILADTWQFDGKHWTQRQDIGPGARWKLAMALDIGRGRVVLFGGLNAFSPNAAAGDPAMIPHLLGDTWEHATAVPSREENREKQDARTRAKNETN
jgi:hypothetical protein